MNKKYTAWPVTIGLLACCMLHCVVDAIAEEEEKTATEVTVRVAKIVQTTLRDYVTVYGAVEPEPASANKPAASARIAASVPGVISEVSCIEGQTVKKGDVLFRLDSRIADAAAEKARAALEFAEKNFERQKKLIEVEGTSQKALQEAELQLNTARKELMGAQAQCALLKIEAPLSGTIVRANAKPGEAVDLNTVLCELIDLKRLVVTAGVPSVEAHSLKAGQAAEIQCRMTPRDKTGQAEILKGTLTFIGTYVDSKTDTTPVRITIPPESGLHPGEFVRVSIASSEKNCLAVPAESVVKDADAGSLIAVIEGDKAIQRPVNAGLRDGNMVEITGDGLKEGMVVVTEGAYGLPKETKVKVVDGPSSDLSSPLKQVQAIPLPEVKGGFDLMAVDVPGKRLFVAAADNHTLEIIDLEAAKVILSVPGLDEPKWVVYRPETSRIYVSTARDGKVTVLDSKSFNVVKTFELKEKANNLRFDPETKQLFVGIGKTFGAIAVIDTADDAVSCEIKLADFPKQFELDGNLIYVNVPKASHIAVVDRKNKEVVNTWPVKEAADNVPMGFDRTNKRLFVACDPGKFVVFDTTTGKSVASLDISAEADGIYYDAPRHRIYVSCGSGSIEVIQQKDADHYETAGKVSTVKGAATSLFVADMDRLFLAVPQSEGQTAEIRIYQPSR